MIPAGHNNSDGSKMPSFASSFHPAASHLVVKVVHFWLVPYAFGTPQDK